MNLILLSQEEADAADAAGGVLELPADDRRAVHVATVLKPEAGASVRLGVVGGGAGRVAVAVLERGCVRLGPWVQEHRETGHSPTVPSPALLRSLPPLPPPPSVELLLAMPRPKVMMRLWSMIAQLGVTRITLTNACRVEKSYFSSQAVDRSRYMAELQEGLEQAVCTRMPEVRIEMRLKPFVEDDLDALCPPGSVQRLVCHPGSGPSIAQAVSRERPGGLLLAIGPEGGWVDFELELLRSRGFEQVSLGPRVLTTEVAVVSLLTLASDALRHSQAPCAKGGPTGVPDGVVAVAPAA